MYGSGLGSGSGWETSDLVLLLAGPRTTELYFYFLPPRNSGAARHCAPCLLRLTSSSSSLVHVPLRKTKVLTISGFSLLRFLVADDLSGRREGPL
jgi:hypothetical protein